MAGADKVNIPLRKLLQHDFFWIFWFGGTFPVSEHNFQTTEYNTANILPFPANQVTDNLLCN